MVYSFQFFSKVLIFIIFFSLSFNFTLWSTGTASSTLLIKLFYSFENFSHQHQLMVSHWSLSDSKSPQVSWTLLSILADVSNVVDWMISTHILIYNSSIRFTNSLVTVPSALITIGITVTFMFHSFFKFPRNIQELIFLSAFLQFYSVVCRDGKVLNSASSLFFFFFVSFYYH